MQQGFEAGTVVDTEWAEECHHVAHAVAIHIGDGQQAAVQACLRRQALRRAQCAAGQLVRQGQCGFGHQVGHGQRHAKGQVQPAIAIEVAQRHGAGIARQRNRLRRQKGTGAAGTLVQHRGAARRRQGVGHHDVRPAITIEVAQRHAIGLARAAGQALRRLKLAARHAALAQQPEGSVGGAAWAADIGQHQVGRAVAVHIRQGHLPGVDADGVALGRRVQPGCCLQPHQQPALALAGAAGDSGQGQEVGTAIAVDVGHPHVGWHPQRVEPVVVLTGSAASTQGDTDDDAASGPNAPGPAPSETTKWGSKHSKSSSRQVLPIAPQLGRWRLRQVKPTLRVGYGWGLAAWSSRSPPRHRSPCLWSLFCRQSARRCAGPPVAPGIRALRQCG